MRLKLTAALSLALLAGGLVLPACSCNEGATPQIAVSEVAPEVVSAYTSGLVSRKSPVKVQLAQESTAFSAVGSPVEGVFRITPEVPGTATWLSSTELSFQPAADLTPGETYTVQVNLPLALPGVPEATPFAFSFTVVRPDFTSEVLGLAADGDGGKQTFAGRIELADVADPATVEKLLTATHASDALTVDWQHDEDGLNHRFTVRGIQRQVEDTTLSLSFDGGPIGVERTDAQDVPVPGLNKFLVNSVRAETVGERHIEIRFSDPLDDKQDLRGLIRVEGHSDLQLAREGSVVRVYASGGWRDTETLTVTGVKNTAGYKLKAEHSTVVSFAPLKPSVRFVGEGVILPTTANLTIPVEATNLRAIEVEATRVYTANVPQFLQVNTLAESSEMRRVGDVVWRSRVELPDGTDTYNRVQRVGLDLGPLVRDNPGGLYRIAVKFKRRDILLDCPAQTWDDKELEEGRWDEAVSTPSFWDYFEGEEGEDGWSAWEHRDDPCRRAFYLPSYDHDLTVSRNVVISDLGLVAKQGADDVLRVVATNLVSAAPTSGATLEVLDYQLQSLARATTDAEGLATVRLPAGSEPFAIVAKSGSDQGWLRLARSAALATSHFDVGGAELTRGLEGFLYGERGIWRPGDDIFLTFALRDAAGTLPAGHPAEFELLNPRGQVVDRRTVTDPVDGFYRMTTRTAADAPTGAYTARVRVGGASFEKSLRVETVVPNRLKIELDNQELVKSSDLALHSTLKSRWLHGAPAPGFSADVELRLAPKTTTFPKYSEYVFDNPLAQFAYESAMVWEGELDENGVAAVNAEIPAPEGAPGMLSGTLRTRVFEPSGAFSVDESELTVSAHPRYVGLKLPKGDASRGMLLTDVQHPASLVMVDESGNPVASGKLEVTLYKMDWRWWWEKIPENLAEYAEGAHLRPLQSGTVDVRDGKASWNFDVKYPDWGRYLVLAKDAEGGHAAGRIVYIDWPGWAGRAGPDQPGGASVLSVSTDKPKAEVGQSVTLTFPMAAKARALVSLESGSKVVQMAWVQPTAGTATTTWTFPVTREMAPGVYANVTVLQPWSDRGNDAPIRMYGITPIEVVDKETRLEPKATMASVFEPESTALVSVSETQGRAMTYTLAVVDEGLLGLTRFKTPNAWSTFYSRKALGVRTWDLFDLVAGAYGGALDGMVAIGGDGSGSEGEPPQAQRFKPMVHYAGPFKLAAGATAKHEVPIGQYVGEVRVMLTAGAGDAWGAFDQSVPVKKPLMLLASLPRQLGVEEEIDLPVSIFALDPKIKEVTVTVTTEGPVSVVGDKKRTLKFSTVGDKLGLFKLKVGASPGVAKVRVTASGGGEKAAQDVELEVRHPGQPESRTVAKDVTGGGTWNVSLALPGVPGTNEAVLELSAMPPLDLARRLPELMRYPHGCIEQTTSAVFPQLYLSKLETLTPAEARKVESHVRAGLTRLRSFQNADGGFGYWPGMPSDAWGSTYAGHFLIEAERAGHPAPSGVRTAWLRYQQERAARWVKDGDQSDLDQAYRLYTLALAGKPDVAAMNRLKESRMDTAARWRLAAAYALAGQKQTAKALLVGADGKLSRERSLSGTYGSTLRDQAMVLEAATVLGESARASKLAVEVSAGLTAEGWLSTQETAYALVALARFAGSGQAAVLSGASWQLDKGAVSKVDGTTPIVRIPLPVGQTGSPALTVQNGGKGVLYARAVTTGVPALGQETGESSGLQITVNWTTPTGDSVRVNQVEHGADLIAQVTVKNVSGRRLPELALSELFPTGWQINGLAPGTGPGFDYRDVRDDRVYTYFDLESGASAEFSVPVNASYAGRYYLPATVVEAMYDASITARVPGQWVTVSAQPEG
jgi:uncharacterized protein YfaS (alpha-2-macroglobulin family)